MADSNTIDALPTDLCLLITQPPQAGVHGQETFEMAVAGGVFDQNITVIFSGAAVMHLLPQEPAPNYKSTGKLWQSASLFGVEALYVVSPLPSDVLSRLPETLQASVQVIETADVTRLMTEAREVMVL